MMKAFIVMMCLFGVGCTEKTEHRSKQPFHSVFVESSATAGHTKVHKQLFVDVAQHLTGAYEYLGKLEDHYDQDGYCGSVEEEDCSIWKFASKNPTLKIVLKQFKPGASVQSNSSEEGTYLGFAHFFDRKTHTRKRLEIRFIYSNNDMDIYVVVRNEVATA